MDPAFIHYFNEAINMTAFKLLLWPFITRHWIGIGSIVVIGFINCYCKLLLPLSIGRYIDLLFGIQTNKGRALSLVGIHLAPGMTVFFIFFFAVLLIRLLTSWAERYISLVRPMVKIYQPMRLRHIVVI
jgi:hypothetical protein